MNSWHSFLLTDSQMLAYTAQGGRTRDWLCLSHQTLVREMDCGNAS